MSRSPLQQVWSPHSLSSSLHVQANFSWAHSSNLTWPCTIQSQSTFHRNSSCSAVASELCTHLAQSPAASCGQAGCYSMVPGQRHSRVALRARLPSVILHTMLQTWVSLSSYTQLALEGHTVTEMLTWLPRPQLERGTLSHETETTLSRSGGMPPTSTAMKQGAFVAFWFFFFFFKS